jgi:Flp pilus assembly pilin Flp
MNQKGTSAVEYAIIVMGIAAAITLAVSLFGEQVKDLFLDAAQIFQQVP